VTGGDFTQRKGAFWALSGGSGQGNNPFKNPILARKVSVKKGKPKTVQTKWKVKRPEKKGEALAGKWEEGRDFLPEVYESLGPRKESLKRFLRFKRVGNR